MNQAVIESALKMLCQNESINRDVIQYVYLQGRADALADYLRTEKQQYKEAA